MRRLVRKQREKTGTAVSDLVHMDKLQLFLSLGIHLTIQWNTNHLG